MSKCYSRVFTFEDLSNPDSTFVSFQLALTGCLCRLKREIRCEPVFAYQISCFNDDYFSIHSSLA